MCIDSECALPARQRVGVRGCAGIGKRGNRQIRAARGGRPIEIVVGGPQAARDYRYDSLVIWST